MCPKIALHERCALPVQHAADGVDLMIQARVFGNVIERSARAGLGIVGAEDKLRNAREQVERMCEQLLANPLIESYEIELHG